MADMIIINEQQARDTVDMKVALDTIRTAYKASASGKRYAPGRVVGPIRGEENCGQWLVANCLDIPYFGSKFSAVFKDNISKGLPSVISTISLYSADTGEQLALISANYLTAVKTGGSAGVATDVMARKDAKVLGIIGTGIQAFTQVMAIQEVRELSELRIFDAIPERMEAFEKKIEAIKNRPYTIVKCSSAKECVSESDIVCTCTASLKPVFDGKDLKAGTHVNAIGSFTPFMQEIDEETVIIAARIITEHVDGLWEAAGDILIPFNKGLIAKEKVVGSVGDCLVGTVQARQNDNEITLYESVGSCVLDVSIAAMTYEACK